MNFFKIIVFVYTYFVLKGLKKKGNNILVTPFLNISNSRYIHIASNVRIGAMSWIGVVTNFNGQLCQSSNSTRLYIGENVSIGNNAFIVANNSVIIGKNSIISSYVFISDHIHTYDDITKPLRSQPLSNNGRVNIGDNVFIGVKASILKNVSIGNNSVIGANSVVINDVPAYSVVAGNPAILIKKYDFKKKVWIKSYAR